MRAASSTSAAGLTVTVGLGVGVGAGVGPGPHAVRHSQTPAARARASFARDRRTFRLPKAAPLMRRAYGSGLARTGNPPSSGSDRSPHHRIRSI
ncbi:hypothetical protein ACFPRL_17145 [Pseudoclavibacter helvolus]